jgi:ABC-type phosphate transport system substrate-binding protein
MHKCFIILLLFTSMVSSHAEESPPLAVIVSNLADVSDIKALKADELSLIYWRKKQYWQGGVRIHPVNLQAEHPLRLSFSKAVLGSPPSEQTTYWNGVYFHGISPPYTVQSDEAVLRYVTNTKGAIGYVDACKVDGRVKPLLWVINTKVTSTPPEKLNCITQP